MFLVRLIGVFVLVALNGFFAAVEFSLVTVRVSRVPPTRPNPESDVGTVPG